MRGAIRNKTLKQKRLHMIVVLYGLTTIIACSPEDGSYPYALWETYEHPDGLYHFHYLSPPWKESADATALVPKFVIGQEGIALAEQGLVGDGLLQDFSVEVRRSWSNHAQLLAESDYRIWTARGAEVTPPLEYQNPAGFKGIIVSGQAEDRWFKVLYYNLESGGLVMMEIAGKRHVSPTDFDLLLAGLEPRAADD